MTNFLVTGQPDWWHVFWVLASWSAAYMVAAVILREVFAKPVTPMEKYGLWFGRIVGIVGASIIFAYGYRTTGELERVEQQVEHYKALATKHATGVSDNDQVAEINVETRNCRLSWLAGQRAFTTVAKPSSLDRSSSDTTTGVRSMQRPIWGQHGSESTGVRCGTDGIAGRGGSVPPVSY